VRILVTGGAGFIGSHLVDRLVAAGHAVRVLDSLEAQVHGEDRSPPAYLNPGAELLVGDVRDRAAVAAALRDVEVVFHQAAAVGVGQSMYEIERYVSANSLGAAVLLEGIVERRAALRRVVVASSMSLYGEGLYRDAGGEAVAPALRPDAQLEARAWEPVDERGEPLAALPTPETKPLFPTSVYAVTKRDHEELFLTVGRAYGIPTVALRYFNVYGPRQALSNPYTGVIAIFSARLLNGKPPVIFEDGRQSRDFVHVSDVVEANLRALQAPAVVGGAYNVGTGRATTILEIAQTLARELDAAVPAQATDRFRAGDIRHCFADVTAARRDLGFRARVSVPEGLRDLLAWLEIQRPDDRVDRAHSELESRGLAR
jgi:dTDP-L-rhamnose 4-epimerase